MLAGSYPLRAANPVVGTLDDVRHLLIVSMLMVVGCSSGVEAPDPQPLSEVCTNAWCMDVPAGWGSEVGDTYVSFHHESDPDHTFLTGNVVDMEAIVTAAGGTWPATTEDVVASFWALLDDAGEGSVVRTQRLVGGAIRSWGTHSTGDMWYVLVPVGGSVGIGVELRGPNATWEEHADIVFPSVTPIP